ncbi:MAG: nitroreductase family protein [Promethearchaeia archaeon]
MNERKLIKLMEERWTARKFKSKDVADKNLDKILEAGRWAPSGGNKQPWELIVIKDKRLKKKIAEIYAEGQGLIKPSKRYTIPPILIAVCIDTRIIDSYPDKMPAEFIVYASIGTMVQNMALLATSMGLSLSWGTQPTVIRENLKKLLEIPEYISIPDILQLGYPAQERHFSDRRKRDDFIHIDTMDKSKLRDL